MKKPAFLRRSIFLLVQIKIPNRRSISIPLPTVMIDEIIRSLTGFMKFMLKMPSVREKLELYAPMISGGIQVTTQPRLGSGKKDPVMEVNDITATKLPNVPEINIPEPPDIPDIFIPEPPEITPEYITKLLSDDMPKFLCDLWLELTSYGSWTLVDIEVGNDVKVLVRFI